MSDPQAGNKSDPFEQWRGMRDAYMESWAKTMVEGVNSEAYAQTSGAMLDACLSSSSPFREAMEKAMLEGLKQLSMPSRSDVISLAERMTNVERRLDDLEIKLDRVLSGILQMHDLQRSTTAGVLQLQELQRSTAAGLLQLHELQRSSASEIQQLKELQRSAAVPPPASGPANQLTAEDKAGANSASPRIAAKKGTR